MFASTEAKYSPKSISEYVFPNSEVERVVWSYLTGKNRRPLLLYGPSGTGKSALTRLIPNAIENSEARVYVIEASSLNNIEGLEKLRGEKIMSVSGAFGNNVMNYCVIEEYERKLTTVASLKVLLDAFKEVDLTMITSNHIDKVDTAIRSRCKELLVPPVPPLRFLGLAQKILCAEGVVLSDERVLGILEQTFRASPDNRKYYETLDELIFAVRAKRNYAQKTKSAA